MGPSGNQAIQAVRDSRDDEGEERAVKRPVDNENDKNWDQEDPDEGQDVGKIHRDAGLTFSPRKLPFERARSTQSVPGCTLLRGWGVSQGLRGRRSAEGTLTLSFVKFLEAC